MVAFGVRLVIEYFGVIHRELSFKYRDSIRAAQFRLIESSRKSRLN